MDVGVGQAHAAALGFARGVGLHVILGIAVTGTDALAYAVGITFADPGTVTVSLAVALGNVAAVVPGLAGEPGPWAGDSNYRVGMKDREIVAAIVASDPAGLAGAYDKYAESLYGY